MNIKVRCNNNYESGFSAGKIYELKDGKIIDDDSEERPMNDETIDSFEKLCGYYDGCDFELVEFTLNDLKPFMLVERRNGEMLLIGQSTHGLCLLDNTLEAICDMHNCTYNQDLTHIGTCSKDIMCVYNFSNNINTTTSLSTDKRDILWRRHETVYISLKEIRDKFNLEKDTVIIVE